jgi:hypothetical protein
MNDHLVNHLLTIKDTMRPLIGGVAPTLVPVGSIHLR